MKAQLNTMFDEKLSLKNTLGYGHFMEKLRGKKPIIKKNRKNQIEEIDHNKSRHTSEVQRSRYISMNDGDVDEEEDGAGQIGNLDLAKKSIKQLLGLGMEELEQEQKKQAAKEQEKSKKVILKYIKPIDVQIKNRNLLEIKSHFQKR